MSKVGVYYLLFLGTIAMAISCDEDLDNALDRHIEEKVNEMLADEPRELMA